MSLDLPIYSKWIETSAAAETNDSSSSLALYQGWSFEGHGEMLEALVRDDFSSQSMLILSTGRPAGREDENPLALPTDDRAYHIDLAAR